MYSLSEENIAQNSEESSNDVASNAEMVGIEWTAQGKDLQDNNKLHLSGEWRMGQHAWHSIHREYRQQGLKHDYFALNNDFLNCFVAETNCYADKFIVNSPNFLFVSPTFC